MSKNANPTGCNTVKATKIDWLLYPFGMFFGDCIKNQWPAVPIQYYNKIIIICHWIGVYKQHTNMYLVNGPSVGRFK